jgi:hypothetical protein
MRRRFLQGVELFETVVGTLVGKRHIGPLPTLATLAALAPSIQFKPYLYGLDLHCFV